MAAARADWHGAINVNGFPVPVAAYKSVAASRPPSFKTLDPKYQRPIRSIYVDEQGEEVPRSATLKGVSTGGDTWVPLGEKALELVAKVDRAEVCEIERFASPESVPFDKALTIYDVAPYVKAPGAEASFKTLWNILHGSGKVAIIPGWSPRSGSYPHTIAVYAVGTRIRIAVLPFKHEMRDDAPIVDVEVNEQAAAMGTMLDKLFTVADYDPDAYADDFLERREAAIQMALDGADELPDGMVAEAPEPAAPDLMAALEGMIGSTEASKLTPKPSRGSKPAPKKASSEKVS